jgi:pimeloyl-ACP methyl ester carboxylesterase
MPTAGSIYYFESKNQDNDQPYIVLIHGAGGTHLHWPYNLRRLNNHRVLALDLPGHGKSDGIGEQSIDRYADAVATWLAELGVKSATIVGHSMGGAIAQSLALNHSNLVESLVLVATGAQLPVNLDLLEKVSKPGTTPAALDMIIKWSFSKETSPKLRQTARRQMDTIRPTVIYGDFIACSRFDTSLELGRIQAPTLVLCGEADKMTPLRFSKQLEENIPDARLVTIPDAGHMVMLEQPEAIAAAIGKFLS